MADHQFNIKLGVKVEKGDSEKQLDSIKKSLEEKKITLKLDISKTTEELNKFKDSLKGVNTKLNDAFKLNNGALDNLKNLKTVLEEINKLSGKTKIQITNSKDADTVTKSLESQKQKYQELLKLKQNLEKQMAKTPNTNSQSYKALQSELTLVTQKAEECKTKISELTQIKMNADMTKNMASQFQTIQKEAQSLKTSLENTLKNSNLTMAQQHDLENFLKTIEKIKGEKLDLRTDGAKTKLQDIRTNLESIKEKYSSIKIEIKTNDNIRSAIKTTNDFINKINSAQKSKTGVNSFIDEGKLNELKTKVKDLRTQLSDVHLKSNVGTEIENIIKKLDRCKVEFKELQNSAKLSMKIGGDINSQTKQIDTMLSKLKEMKQWKIGSNAYIDESKINEAISKLEQYKNELKNLDVNDEKVTSEFETIKTKINETTQEIKEFQNQAKQKMNMESNSASIEALRIKITQLKDAEKITAEQAEQLRQKLNQIAQMDTGKQVNAMKQFRNEIKRATDETARLQSATKRTNSFFSNLYSTMSTFSLGNIITKAIYGISDTIRELDKAFIGLAKVAPDSFHNTTEELESVRQKAVEVGQEVARSATDIINSTASALQLGVSNIDRAMEYAKNVNLYANVAEIPFCLCS